MSAKSIALELASFLDSPQAKALESPEEPEIRRIAELFISVCYDELGKKPNLLDGHDIHVALGHQMPAHLAQGDPLAEHVPSVLAAFYDHLESAQVVTQAFEIKRGLQATTQEFLDTVRTGHNAHHAHHAHHAPQKPFVHGAPKLGRNDPCSCGSGKKYKKCHGKRG